MKEQELCDLITGVIITQMMTNEVDVFRKDIMTSCIESAKKIADVMKRHENMIQWNREIGECPTGTPPKNL